MAEKTYTKTVAKINLDGKHIEFWFQEGPETGWPLEYHESCKKYKFWNAVYESGLSETDILNHGIVGVKITWTLIGYNYEPTKVFLPTQ